MMYQQTEAIRSSHARLPIVAKHIIEPEFPEHWYVVYTEARKENTARINLAQQGFETYLPLYKILKKVQAPGGGTTSKPAFEPMFPRYMFFRPATLRQSISTVRSTRGVTAVVRFGTSFALVSEDIVAAIRAHETARNETDLSTAKIFRPGSRIKMNTPALSGMEGLVHSISAQRIVVLLEILGRQTRVKARFNQVEPV